jgi:3-oxoacyl-[acyl-carrier protein] reductase
MKLKGNVAIVTGSSSVTGIGSECAMGLAAKGCNIAINYMSNERGARETAAACVAKGVEAITVQGDVSQDADCRRMVQETLDRWGRLDVLINNAATTRPIPQRDLDAVTAEEFHRVYAVNVVGTFQMTRAATPHLRASGDGAVVNISSIGGLLGNGSSMPYAVSKGALNTLTLALARQLAPEVRVNAICPGGLLGNWTRKIMSEEGYRNRVAETETLYPLKKGVWPVDVARLAVWLAGEAPTVTGEVYRMDSGQHLL